MPRGMLAARWGRYNTCTARTPRALLRRTPRAAASSLAVLPQHKAAVRPVLALQPQAASALLRAGPLFELTPALKGAAKVRAVLASSP